MRSESVLNKNSNHHKPPISIIKQHSFDEGSKSTSFNQEQLVYQSKEWYFYSKNEKVLYAVNSIFKFTLFIFLLYIFLLSLNFMTIGFAMISSKTLKYGDMIRFILSNPLGALSLGIIVTALLQNATATTSIAVR
jgi:hypothetical protein